MHANRDVVSNSENGISFNILFRIKAQSLRMAVFSGEYTAVMWAESTTAP